MSYSCQTGKALLVIERLDSKLVPFRVHAFIQSSSDGASGSRDCARQDFEDLLSTNTLPAPNVAYKLKPGDRVWISVVYEFAYHCDYWGEWDVSLQYLKQKTLKRKIA